MHGNIYAPSGPGQGVAGPWQTVCVYFPFALLLLLLL
jgi:hypothetical protein